MDVSLETAALTYSPGSNICILRFLAMTMSVAAEKVSPS